ncbi:MAG: carbohydrate kinase, partial [Ferruginibacter sp.]|nr:carbohydrate kinase [Cytophagales bacterium]
GEAFATVTGATEELYNTDGSQGAARAAGLGAGLYTSEQKAFTGLRAVRTIEPNAGLTDAYHEAYQKWRKALEKELSGPYS